MNDAEGNADGGGAGGRLFVWIQYLLPQHALSRLVLAATRVRTRWFKNWTIRGFLKLYRVDMSEAAETDPYRYGSFNEFFTRALKAGARPIAGGDPGGAGVLDQPRDFLPRPIPDGGCGNCFPKLGGASSQPSRLPVAGVNPIGSECGRGGGAVVQQSIGPGT